MVTAKESRTCQQFSAWDPPNLDHMSRFQLDQSYNLQGFPATTFTTNVALQGNWPSNLRSLDMVQQNAVADSLKLLPHNGNIPHPTDYPYFSDSQFALPNLPPQYGNISRPNGYTHVKDSQFALPHNLGVTDKPIDTSVAPQKRFLIFDKSGSQTRLFCSPFMPANPILPSEIPATANGYREKISTQVDRQVLVKPTVKEKSDENDLADGEGEMLEDSDEINALLYSDSDDEYNDDDDDDGSDSEDDEVTSTGHTPLIILDGYVNNKLLNELTEEVASSDDSPKRHRLLDGRYKKSSLASFDSPMKQASYEDDTVSSCAAARSYCDGIDSSKREKKVRIRNALKIIESIIPGSKDNDPVSIINKAIAYLKTMKIEAEALGLSSPESELTSFSQ